MRRTVRRRPAAHLHGVLGTGHRHPPSSLGEETISYFGFSYGSELGATWATLFPDTVRAAVLDGAADPTNDYTEGGLAQAKGFEQQLDTFLARCSDDDDCSFHNDGDAEGAFDALMDALDTDPLVVSTDRAPVNQGVAVIAVANAMYSELLWPELEDDALARAQDGEGDGLLGLYDDYLDRQPDGTYEDGFEAFQSITCVDDPGPRTIEEADAQLPRFLEVAPRLGEFFASGYTCTLWPIEPAARWRSPAPVRPIVVVGTTGDAATPLESSRVMADTLEDGRFVIVEADQHTGYGVNDCINDTIDDYLVDLEPPRTSVSATAGRETVRNAQRSGPWGRTVTWRKGWDLNPRRLAPRTLSRRVPLAARAPFRGERLAAEASGHDRRSRKKSASRSADSAARTPWVTGGLWFEPWVGAHVVEAGGRPGLQVGGTVDEAPDPGVEQRTGAHEARFQRDDQRAVVEPPASECRGGVAQCQDLGVRRRVTGLLALVVTSGDHTSVVEHDGADGHVAVVEGRARLVERVLHRRVVGEVVVGESHRRESRPATTRSRDSGRAGACRVVPSRAQAAGTSVPSARKVWKPPAGSFHTR